MMVVLGICQDDIDDDGDHGGMVEVMVIMMMLMKIEDLHMVPRGLILQLSQQGPMLHSASILSLKYSTS